VPAKRRRPTKAAVGEASERDLDRPGAGGGSLALLHQIDLVSVDRRVIRGRQRDADIGVGFRSGVPGSPGNIRVDVGRGLRDGALRVSVGFEP